MHSEFIMHIDPWGSAPDAVAAAACGLGALVLVRLVLRAALRAGRRAKGLLSVAAVHAYESLRPGFARRVTAGLLGIGAPLSAWAPSASATHSPMSATPRPAGTPLNASPDHASTRHAMTGPAPTTPGIHLVRPGETLWDIARHHLSRHAGAAEVARSWPRWYAANRELIGPDPALIVPGQRLRIPGHRPAGTPTQTTSAPAPGPSASESEPTSALSFDPDRR
jgi:LysM repeat protein